jgi:hypothetical protein
LLYGLGQGSTSTADIWGILHGILHGLIMHAADLAFVGILFLLVYQDSYGMKSLEKVS